MIPIVTKILTLSQKGEKAVMLQFVGPMGQLQLAYLSKLVPRALVQCGFGIGASGSSITFTNNAIFFVPDILVTKLGKTPCKKDCVYQLVG